MADSTATNSIVDGINIGSVLINLVIGLITSYIVLLVRSVRKEFKADIELFFTRLHGEIDTIKQSCNLRTKSCEEKFSDCKSKVDDIIIRARKLDGIESRLEMGNQRFDELSRRIGWLEDKD